MDDTKTATVIGVGATSTAETIRCLCPVVVGGDSCSLEPWRLERPRLTVGRDPGGSGLVIDDPQISRRHVALTWSADGCYFLKDLDSHNGTYVDGVSIDEAPLVPDSVIRIGHSLLVYAEISVEAGMTFSLPPGGSSLAHAHAQQWTKLVAPTATPVLIQGPTGAGKERLVHQLHEQSGRSGPFIAVNCANFSKELIRSELFGHVRGAFSGAETDRAGLIVSADGGTLFLDEIAELPLELQASLLRVLQERCVRAIGSDVEQPVDVRVVAASHAELEVAVANGRFRSDLYARLAGLTIHLPGLAHRREEIISLFGILGEGLPPLSLEAAEALLLYDWPRNVRELEYAAGRARLLGAGGERVQAAHLPAELLKWASDRRDTPLVDAPAGAPSREALIAALTESGGSIAAVAEACGKHRMQIYRWLKAYQLDAKNYRRN